MKYYKEMSREKLLHCTKGFDPNLPSEAVAIAILKGEESGVISAGSGSYRDMTKDEILSAISSLEACGIDGDWGEIDIPGAMALCEQAGIDAFTKAWENANRGLQKVAVSVAKSTQCALDLEELQTLLSIREQA